MPWNLRLRLEILCGGGVISVVPKFQQNCARIAKVIYGVINSGFRYPAADEPLASNSDMWTVGREVVEGQAGMRGNNYFFKLKPGVLPSVALKDLVKKGGVAECNLIFSLVTQTVILKDIGEESFDRLYASDFQLPKRVFYGLDVMDHAMPMLPGESGYISNIVHYHKFHPQGSASGQNVWCVDMNAAGEPLYLGFGGFFSTSRTYQEIVDYLYQETIKPIDPGFVGSPLGSIHEIYSLDRAVWELGRATQQAKFKAYHLMSDEEFMTTHNARRRK